VREVFEGQAAPLPFHFKRVAEFFLNFTHIHTRSIVDRLNNAELLRPVDPRAIGKPHDSIKIPLYPVNQKDPIPCMP